jgi:hypothetical protein
MMYFFEGGPFMYVILLSGLLIGGWGVLGVVLAVVGRFATVLRLPAKIGNALGLMATPAPVLLGIIAWQLGLIQVSEAVRSAGPDMKEPLQLAGSAIAAYPLWFGLLVTGGLLPICLVGMVLAMLPVATPAD